MQSILILGRQAELGRAELESLYGSNAVRPVGDHAVVVDVDPCLLAFDRLGGSVKFAKLLTTLDTTKWKKIESFLVAAAPQQVTAMPEGKMHLGISTYGFTERLTQIEATALTIKKAIRKTGRSVRVVPNKAHDLSSAQVHHNKLTTPNGWELLFIRDGDKTIIAQTVKVQNISSYTTRDRERPARDSKVGMLPPKLAQIIINLAVGQIPDEKLQNICDIPADQAVPLTVLNKTILDPFCGTGVVLQEATLMGYHATGTDVDARMISYTSKNLEWLHDTYSLPDMNWLAEVGDATNHRWKTTPDFVAAEAYLGRPFTAQPTPEILQQTMSECNVIIKKFFKNIAAQVPAGTRLCIAVPAWVTSVGSTTVTKRLPLVDQIEDLGYNRISFESAGSAPLIYHRDNQIVARDLLVISKQ